MQRNNNYSNLKHSHGKYMFKIWFIVVTSSMVSFYSKPEVLKLVSKQFGKLIQIDTNNKHSKCKNADVL